MFFFFLFTLKSRLFSLKKSQFAQCIPYCVWMCVCVCLVRFYEFYWARKMPTQFKKYVDCYIYRNKYINKYLESISCERGKMHRCIKDKTFEYIHVAFWRRTNKNKTSFTHEYVTSVLKLAVPFFYDST